MNKPNVLFIMSDDHASNAISCYGSRLAEVFKTPNLDRIANEGLRLDHFYSTNSICTPARATIMTGQYGHINGVRTLSDKFDPCKGLNLAKIFNDNGYETSLFGKWHLHCTPEGFDEYKILSGEGGQGTYQSPEFDEKGKGIVTHNGYVTDVITGMVEDYFDNTYSKDKPFFMMCHHKAPHDFWEYPERHEHLFDGVDIPLPNSLFEDRAHRSEASRNFGSSVTPRSSVRSLYEDFSKDDYVTGKLVTTEDMTFEEKGIAAYQKYLKDYLRTVAGIDDSVAAVLKKLEDMGELDNTIVIYTSDQGMYLGEHDYQDKRWSFEESLKAPFMIRYPKLLPVGKANKNLMANIDVAPTLLDFCGIDIPEEMQGVSAKDILIKENAEDYRDEIYFRYWMHLAHRHDNPAHLGIRTREYKLIYYYGHALDANGAIDRPTAQGYELYDMINDPFELKNLYEDEAYKDVVADMTAKLKATKEKYKDYDCNFKDIVKI